MKLIQATFKNFRLLKELTIDFSIDPDLNLTVIRAENESGKTTMLTALQWAFYGERALPGNSKDFRIYPIDWDFEEFEKIDIEVQLVFEHRFITEIENNEVIEKLKRFRLIRSMYVKKDGKDVKNGKSNISLYELTSEGDTPLPDPELVLQDIIPIELREIFFTDGDRALSFIEADISTTAKRQRVKKSIRSLLGLNVIENSINHLTDSIKEVNKKVRQMSDTDEERALSKEIEEINTELSILEPRYEEIINELADLELEIKNNDKDIESVLLRGDQEQLSKDRENTRKRIEFLEKRKISLEKDHSNLLKDKDLFSELTNSFLEKALSILSSLKDKGTIPSNTVPVLQERLKIGKCLCGATLDKSTEGGRQRVSYIQQLIDEQKEADQLRDYLTELYFNSSQLLSNNDWVEICRSIIKQQGENEEELDEFSKKMKIIELKLKDLDDTDIIELRKLKTFLKNKSNELSAEKGSVEQKIRINKQSLIIKNKAREDLLKNQKKNLKLLSELYVAQDIETILRNTYDAILNDELKKVSNEMNKLFLKMIYSDPEQGAIINKAEITKEFDIKVYGTHNRALDPDRDLNGASRRALTISFILALTKVSEVIAPNVIDTPLGMTSGHVKKSLLETTAKNSSQLILFLTPSEIENCQEIIDQYANYIVTLTSTVHYPLMLVNQPEYEDQRIMKCDCDHYEYCKTCEREGYKDNPNLNPRIE